ncbi:hypothetical protein N431DRAFT_154723 [Stipitochalara longipes BDJ]|nr:hypothetical protein N431DRAFT_154723 [Stipitochalara longipes BDJ]
MSNQDEMFVGNTLSNNKLRYLRKVGLGFLLAGVFVPLDLLTLVVVGAAGVYFCIRAVEYLRQRLALYRILAA